MSYLKGTIRQWWVILLLCSCLAFSFVSDQFFLQSKYLELNAQILKEINSLYVDPVSTADLMKKGIDGMCKTLDPYTIIIAENDIIDYRFKTTGNYGGIGIILSKLEDSIVLEMAYSEQPGYKAGLRIGDKIIEINGTQIGNKSLEEVEKMISGAAGTMATVRVSRKGENALLSFNALREEVKVPSVPYSEMLNTEIGYLLLTGFTDKCSADVQAAIEKLKKANPNMHSIVIDLRNNGGGFLNEAVNIMNLFVDKGTAIVTTKGKLYASNNVYKTNKEIKYKDLKVVVLTNKGSASASEIVSGSMQDLDRGVVVGQRTYGKGLVQITKPISYGNQIKVTTSKYYTPSGRCIQVLDYKHRQADGSVGVVPDSLKNAFKTSLGRTVYDGGGIDPDVIIVKPEASLIVKTLKQKNLFFDFALNYFSMHKTCEFKTAKEFKTSDAQINEFVQFLKNKNYNYISPAEKRLELLIKAAQKENYFEAISSQISLMKTSMAAIKQNDFEIYKNEIKHEIAHALVPFYFNQKGQVENGFEYDLQLQEAINILNNKTRYEQILSKK